VSLTSAVPSSVHVQNMIRMPAAKHVQKLFASGPSALRRRSAARSAGAEILALLECKVDSGATGRLAFHVIILFCGIPGSGKSTIAGLLAARLAELGDVRILSSDNLRAPVYKKIFDAIAAGRKPGELLILDATFFQKELRRQVKILAQSENVIRVYLDCPLEVALQRNRARRPNISEKAVRVVFHRMEPPAHPSLRIDTAAISAAGAAARIFEFVKNRIT